MEFALVLRFPNVKFPNLCFDIFEWDFHKPTAIDQEGTWTPSTVEDSVQHQTFNILNNAIKQDHNV